MLPPASEWENFYVIVGSSAAALTGLQFVVVALGADSKTLGGTEAVEAFGTPTIVHFCAVLLIAAILSTPRQTAGSLSLCFALSGLAGLAYACFVMVRARRQTGYTPVLEDWIWHAGLPMFAYTLLFVAGVAIYWHPVSALYFIAVAALLLLFIGIHNAWDAAVYISMKKKE